MMALEVCESIFQVTITKAVLIFLLMYMNINTYVLTVLSHLPLAYVLFVLYQQLCRMIPISMTCIVA